MMKYLRQPFVLIAIAAVLVSLVCGINHSYALADNPQHQQRIPDGDGPDKRHGPLDSLITSCARWMRILASRVRGWRKRLNRGTEREEGVTEADGKTCDGQHGQSEEEAEWCKDCNWDDLNEKLECEDIQGIRQVPSVDDYMVMRRAYEEVVGEESSTISPVAEEDSFMVPHRAGQAGHKGRGIFATEFVPRGTRVLNHRQVATFRDGRTVREFLSRIPRPSACDYLQWAYTEWNEGEQRYEQSVDLDDSALCNDGETEAAQNVGCDPAGSEEHEDPDCVKYAYATRDIQPGEEMLCLYDAFSEGNEGATALGLGWRGDGEGENDVVEE